MTTNYLPPAYRTGPSPFFMASCGCIGLFLGHQQFIAVRRCQMDDLLANEYGLDYHGNQFDPRKTYEPLTDGQTLAILENLNTLIAKGYRYDSLLDMLRNQPVPLPFKVSIRYHINADGSEDYDKKALHVHSASGTEI